MSDMERSWRAIGGRGWRAALAVLLAVVVGACGSEAAPEAAETAASGTQRMAERLAELRSSPDPRTDVYANAARVELMLRTGSRPGRGNQLQFATSLAHEMLRAGRTEEAVEGLETVQAELRGDTAAPPSFRAAVDDLLGIAYLRLGEEQNCIDGHMAAMCLLPISEEGVHELQEGSRKAVAQYTKNLERDPDDMVARWLLNVGYMTLGLYPDSVPEPWLITPAALTSEHALDRFPDVAPAVGLDVLGRAGGVVMDDFDGDGLLDIMASSWGLADPIRVFRNQGDGRFEERTGPAGLDGLTGGLNLVQADYDNDGDIDVLVLRGGWDPRGQPNSLLRNDGAGNFEDVTEAAGLLSERPTQTAAWADYDGDGRLDLFIGNESQPVAVRPSELLRNNGDGTFTDVAAEAGAAVVGFVKGVAWGDYDNDGRPDLYVSRLGQPNVLLRNLGADEAGAVRFSDVTAEAGVAEPVESFPTWFWDYDNDGWLDLWVSGYRASAGDVAAEYLGMEHDAELPRLYRNNRDGTFSDVTRETRMDRIMYTMGTNHGDLDGDGWLDFYSGTGDPDFRAVMPNRMFRNAEGRRFQDVTTAGDFGHLQKGHGVAFGDIDHDGDQDVYAVMGGAFEGDIFTNVLFANPGHGNRWLILDLEGVDANRSAVGARIRVRVAGAGGQRDIHVLVGSGGSFGASPLRAEIGLGRADSIHEVEVRWPGSGTVDTLTGLAPNTAYRLREGGAPAPVPLTRFRLPGGPAPADGQPAAGQPGSPDGGRP